MYYESICSYLGLNGNRLFECEAYSLSKLDLGVVAFNNYITSMVQDLIQGKTQRFGAVTGRDIWDYSSSVEFLTESYTKLLHSWNTSLQGKINSDMTMLNVLISVTLAV